MHNQTLGQAEVGASLMEMRSEHH